MFQSMRSSTARTSLRDCRIGLPTSLVVSCAHSSASCSSRSRNARSAAARSAYGRAAHAGCAARARATFCATSPASVIATDRIDLTRRRVADLERVRLRDRRRLALGTASARRARRRAAAAATGSRRGAANGLIERRRRPRSDRARGAASSATSFWPGRRSSRCTKLGRRRAAPSASSTSASERNECQRSVRCLSSPGVCAPRSSSTPSSVDSGRSRPSASSATCRCLMHTLAGRLDPPRQLLGPQRVERRVDHRSRCSGRSDRGSSTGCTRSRPRSATADSCRAS